MTPDPAVEMPANVTSLFDGSQLPTKVGATALLATTTADGWPHLAMLSVGEIFAPNSTTLRLALHAESGTTHAIEETGQALLLVVVDQVATRVRMRVRPAHATREDNGKTAYFFADVVDVVEDRAAYARLVSGITYELLDPDATVAMWREKLEVLKAL